MARSLALAAAGRSRHRPRRLFPAHGGGVRAGVDAARAEPHRGSATARSQFRPAASAGHRDRGRDRGPDRRFLFGRAVACPYRTRPARGQDAQGRDPDAAARAARSLRRARLGSGAGGGDVLCCRRRTDEACRRRVRLAGRNDARQLPRRCLGEPATLYRPTAGDLARPAARRAGANRRPALGAGGKHAGHPRDRNSSRRRHKRRARRASFRRAKQQRRGHGGAPVRDQRRRGGHRARRCRKRRHLAIHCHPGQAADHRARQGSGRSGARRVAALLQARGRLRRRRRAGDVQAADPPGDQRATGACRRRAPRTGSDRAPRI